MGVKELWSVLAPYKEEKPIVHLSGQAVAIDLSGWVCQSKNAVEDVPKIYLRNLFYRTAFLLMANITPVFVLEGKYYNIYLLLSSLRNIRIRIL
jgi:flap endonuclease GEN